MHFTEGKLHLVNKHVGRGSTFFGIREMQIKIVNINILYPFHLHKNMISLMLQNVGEDVS